MQSPEEYRKNPIYETDFNKTVPEIIEGIRNGLTNIHDLGFGYPFLKERIAHIDGLVVLHNEKEEIIKQEIKFDDQKYGESISFKSRGIGLDSCPGCFVCGGGRRMLNNISAFVKSTRDGRKIVSWFNDGAYLDYRPNEPSWLQVKIGACDKHLPNLEKLNKSNGCHGVLRAVDVTKATDL